MRGTRNPDVGKKVYLVVGTTGEYSDRSDWPVAGYLSEENAKRHRDAASAYAAEVHKKYTGMARYTEEWKAAVKANPHDPEMTMDYTGTDYEIWTAPLRDGDAS